MAINRKTLKGQMLAKLLFDICIESAFPLVISARVVVGVQPFFLRSNLSFLVDNARF